MKRVRVIKSLSRSLRSGPRRAPLDEQRRIEEERRRLAVTIESLGDGLLVTEPGSSTIATANPRAAELVPELPVGARTDADDSPLPPLEAALHGETLVEHRGRALAVTAAPLGAGSDGVVWTVRDMSERARLERAKSEFVATASHELRSPLTSIKGFVELLERSPENMSERQREFVDIILRSTDRLVDLVNDLLDVARIEADRVEIHRRPIDVGAAVREVVELMGPRIAGKRQHLGVYVAPTLPLALADPSRVRQIVANLLTNAHLYTSEGGRIHVGVEPDRAWVQIIVQDLSGRPARGGNPTRREGVRGRRRVRRADDRPPVPPVVVAQRRARDDPRRDRQAVRPQRGRGVRVDRRGDARADRGADPMSRGVLVVDDDPFIRKLIATTLEDVAGFELHEASDGLEALEVAQRERPSLVFLDVDMPGLDGIDACRRLREDHATSGSTIVMLTAVHGDSVERRAEEAGADLFLTKPFSPLELLRLVDRLGEQSSA
jgi:signal transduction histidine kinase/CheY-like chemotaxis protein